MARIAKFVARPSEKRPWSVYRKGTGGFMFALLNRPAVPGDLELFHKVLVKAFQARGIADVPKYEDSKIVGAWRTMLSKHGKAFERK